jgi:hypothetical protein
VPVAKEQTLVVPEFPSIDKAADAVPEILPHLTGRWRWRASIHG